VFSSNNWREKQTFEVTEELGIGESKKLNISLSTIERINGHNVQYVTLNTGSNGAKFSSGYNNTNIRNVLFFVGEEMDATWLFKTHKNLVLCLCKLRENNDYDNKEEVVGLYVNVVKKDTDGDGKLTENDLSNIALLNVDGSGYKDVETGIKQIIDSSVTDDGQNVMFLVQVGAAVLMKKYSLRTLNKVSERKISEITKKQ
jgi:hypothetical protein